MIKNEWEKLHKEKRHQPKWPAEMVVRFVKSHIIEGASVLDAGCGAGRHVVFLAKENYVPYGIDFSLPGVKATRGYLSDEGFSEYCDNIIQGGIEELPYSDESFEAVISCGVIYYLPKAQIKKSLCEMGRVLKKGGWLMLYVRSLNDYRFNANNVLKEDSHGCLINESDPMKSASKENGMTMHFFDKHELGILLNDFSNVTIDTNRRGHGSDAFFDEDYIVVCRKQ